MTGAVSAAAPGQAVGVRVLNALGRVAAAFIVPLALLVLWTLSTRYHWTPPQMLPAPEVVWQSFADLWQSGDAVAHTEISLLRVITGFAAGASLGFLLGLAMGLSPTIEDYLRPLFTAMSQVPALGWVPLLMLLVGIDESLKVIIIARAALVPVTLNTLAGIREVPKAYREVGAVFCFGPWQVIRRIVLPAAIPPIFTGIRYGLTHAWQSLIAVELLASSEGLGYLLVWGRQMFQLDLVIVAMAIIGAIGFVMDYALGRVETRLQRWRFADL